MAAVAAPDPPIMFQGERIYSKVTTLPVEYTPAGAGAGAQKQRLDVPLLTLPPGTVLFRGVRLPDTSAGDDPRAFFTDYLGSIEGRRMCLSPVHNVFFYPTPFVPFGIHTVGGTFQAIHVYVTMRPLTVIANVSPSRWVRGGDVANYDGDAPYQKCNRFSYDCHPQTLREQDAKKYDNCIHPAFAKRQGVRGWMALADLDSLKPYKLRDGSARDAPMSQYLLGLQSRIPGVADELLSALYTDARKHTGFPEIALFPLKTHPGPQLTNRNCANEIHAMKILEHLAAKDELNFMPIASITSEGVADMVKGFYSFSALPPKSETISQPQRQAAIEVALQAYLTSLKQEGIDLPFYGRGTISYDTRTGFYVFPQLIPRPLMVSGPPGQPPVPYKSLLIALNTPELRQRALEYAVIFRSYFPEKYMEKYPLAKGFGIRRAMVLERPGFFKRWYEELGLPMPPALQKLAGRASFLFQQNSGRAAAAGAGGAGAGAPRAAGAPLSIRAPAAAAAAGAAAAFVPGGTPPGTPPGAPTEGYGVNGGTPPGPPPENANTATPAYAAMTPPADAGGAGGGGEASPTYGYNGTNGTPKFGGASRRRRTRRATKTSQKSSPVARLTPLNSAQRTVVKQLPDIFKTLWNAAAFGKKHPQQ